MFLPFAPKERLGESFAAADVFIVSLQSGLAGYIVPSKLYGILAAGRPYVAAVEDECEVASLARRTSAAWSPSPATRASRRSPANFLPRPGDGQAIRRQCTPRRTVIRSRRSGRTLHGALPRDRAGTSGEGGCATPRGGATLDKCVPLLSR